MVLEVQALKRITCPKCEKDGDNIQKLRLTLSMNNKIGTELVCETCAIVWVEEHKEKDK